MMYSYILLMNNKFNMMKQLFLKLIVCVTMLATGGCALHKTSDSPKQDSVAEMKPDVLFIAYDYGESLAFKAVIPYLKSRHISVKVLTFGAADKALSDLPGTVPLKSLFTSKELQDNKKVVETWTSSRSQTLPSKLLESVITKIKPRIVITGMASSIQAQLSNQFVLKGAYTVAFYDNFDLPDKQPFIEPWLNTTIGVNELFLPGNYLIDSFLKIKALSGSEITVVGQPALEAWVASVNNIRKAGVLKELGLTASKPVVVFAAGYDADAIKWLDTFIDTVADRPDFQVEIALHPKMQGQVPPSIERKVVNLSNVHIAPAAVSTQSLVKVADVVVTHKSTVGMKAAYVGVPVLYVAENSYNNILIENKLAMRASSWSEIMNALHRFVDRKSASYINLKALGIPSQPIVRFDSRLLDILKGFKKPSRMPVIEQLKVEKKKIPRH